MRRIGQDGWKPELLRRARAEFLGLVARGNARAAGALLAERFGAVDDPARRGALMDALRLGSSERRAFYAACRAHLAADDAFRGPTRR